MRQPVLGLVLAGSSLVLGYALFHAGVRMMEVQNVEFLLRVPVAFVFGTILVLNMCQNSLVTLAQPMKGVLNVATAAAAGSLLLVVFQQMQVIREFFDTSLRDPTRLVVPRRDTEVEIEVLAVRPGQ